MVTPSFFIVGAPKCGTTALYEWLKSHPGVFMPAGKEPHYFAQHLSDKYARVRDEKSYLNLFSGAREGQIAGEASVYYSFHPESLHAILEFNPAAKMILMLRNPVDMLASYHGQLVNNLDEDEQDLEKAWRLQDMRAQGKHLPNASEDPELLDYRDCCALGRHLQNFIDSVPEGQRKIILLDDLAASPLAVYKDILTFLGLAYDGRTDFLQVNESSVLRSRTVRKWIMHPPKVLNVFRPLFRALKISPSKIVHRLNRKKAQRKELSPAFRAELLETFESDIQIIESALQRDLSPWR